MYSSPYSGAFNLLDTMYIPRACASQSFNLSAATYFYGQNKLSFNIRNQATYDAVGIFAQMDKGYEYIFQNGTTCSALAWLDPNFAQSNLVWIQSDDENLVGTQRTLIRGCNSMNKLLEINLYINVSSNSAPEFNTDIQTQWNINVGDKIHYALPPFTVPEGNDVGQVYINAMEGQDFPPFINFTNATNTINMTPNNMSY